MIIILRDNVASELPYGTLTLADVVITESGTVLKNRYTQEATDPVAFADALSSLLQCVGAE